MKRFKNKIIATTLLCIGGLTISDALAQSSSLFVQKPTQKQTRVVVRRDAKQVNTQLQEVSWIAVRIPPPREFKLHDHVTIIIRESSSTKAETTLETEKDGSIDASVEAHPSLNLSTLLRKGLIPSTREQPALRASASREFTGEGEQETKDSFVSRLTARVVDIKPNGTLAVEARTFTQVDKEKMTITVTGFIRPDAVEKDGTVLSTKIFDLRVVKKREGELRRSTRKGWLTRLFEAVVPF